MTLKCSVAFATSRESCEHTRIAEQLGFQRAFFYDSPAFYPDVWVELNRAAERTTHIKLGPGVASAGLRHPMVAASAVGTLISAAGRDRVFFGIGSGFTARLAMGERPVRWAAVLDYALTLKALLRGEKTTWNGALMQMLPPAGPFMPSFPIEVPIVVAAQGRLGFSVARQVADEVMTILQAPAEFREFRSCVLVGFGTVLDPGERPDSDRVLKAAGAPMSVVLHYALEHNLLDEMLPGRGREWAAAYDVFASEERHLALHEGHMVEVSKWDEPFITGDLIAEHGLALSPAQMRDKVASVEAAGATEYLYQPSGPDIPRELESFAKAVFD